MRKQYGDVYTMLIFGKTYAKVYKPTDVEALMRLPEKKASLVEAYIELAGSALPQPDRKTKMRPELENIINPILQSATPLIAHSVRPHNLKSWVPDIEEVLQQRFDTLPSSGKLELFEWCQDLISSITVRMMLGSKVANDPELLQTFVRLFFQADPERGFGTPLGALATIGEVAILGERKIYARVRELLFPFIDEEIEKCAQRSMGNGQDANDDDEQDSSALASMVSGWYHRKLNAPENQLTHSYPQLESAILEMGRLYTPGDFHRKLREDWKLPSNPSIVVPKGTVVLASAFTSMRDPARFDNPKQIDWNRGYKKAGAMFMPFGAGSHPCVGKRFALLEIALLTAQTIQQLDINLLDEDALKDHGNDDQTAWNAFSGEIVEGVSDHPRLDLTQPGYSGTHHGGYQKKKKL